MNIIFGAMGRHNFGDLLMPHVIEKMLPNINFTVADLIESDMTQYGGHEVKSISSFFDSDEMVNVIHAGGETGACSMACALHMLGVWEYDKRYDDISMGYVLPKSVFKNTGKFITNSIGGVGDLSSPILSEFDYNAYRDLRSCKYGGVHVPDCAVMVRELFDDKIQARNVALKDMHEYMGDYIAVQISAKILKERQSEIETELLELVEKTDLPIVLFCAGIAPSHDSLEVYADKLGDFLPSGMLWYCDDFNIWSICNVIANAKLYIGTSLHARIIAMLYDVPRISIESRISTEISEKIRFFIKEWDTMKKRSINIAWDSQKLLNSHVCGDSSKIIQSYKNSIKEWATML